ncbi:MAG: glycosyltransferase family 39 protein [Candidatus Bathyarchaeia archaeon]
MRRYQLVILLLSLSVACTLRAYRLDIAGFSEDETYKLLATTAYRQGDIGANAEHPMLMKMACTLSILLSERLNLMGLSISPETALRLPNVVIGTLTGLILYLFASRLFSVRVGLLTALVWSLAVPAIMLNRIAKEDTFLVFFTWTGFYLFHIAKQATEEERHKFYAASGISFGMMLASKYFPHYMGLNFLYYHLLGSNTWNRKIRPLHLLVFFTALAVALLVFNPILLKPGILAYMVSYLNEQKQTHQGLWMMGRLYHNEVSALPGTTPTYFYLLAMALKIQLPLLLGLLVGMVELWRKRNDETFLLKVLLVLWIVPFSLFPAKWLRYMLSLMPILSIIIALGLLKLADLIGKHLGSVVMAVLLLSALISAVQIAPFYSLYLNLLGRGRIGYFFPHDEFYDLGLREAVQAIAREAHPGATLVCETPYTARYYADRFGRTDLKIEVSSARNFRLSPNQDNYLIVQDGRRYFENLSLLNMVEQNYRPALEIEVLGASALRVYHIGPGVNGKKGEVVGIR